MERPRLNDVERRTTTMVTKVETQIKFYLYYSTFALRQKQFYQNISISNGTYVAVSLPLLSDFLL